SPQEPQPLKFIQKFAYQTREWSNYYGMRNLVESSFGDLKKHNHEDLDNPTKRSGRGYTFHYLAATLAVISANIRRIINYFKYEAAQTIGGKLTRIRRRKDPHGNPLPRTAAPPGAPPIPA